MRQQVTGSGSFPTTQWSVVLEASARDPRQASAALEKLCGRYWFPVYAHIRQQGQDPHTAEDLTQGFFQFILERNTFDRAVPERGRFRSFLLASLTNYLRNEHDRRRTLKRGGGCKLVSLDELRAEELYRLEPTDHQPPEKRFERRWAIILVRRTIEQLRSEFEQRGQAALFSALQPALTGETDNGAHDRLAQQLGMTPGAVKVSLHRARRRFGELLRHEVAHTVSRPDEVEVEMRHLLAAIAD